MKYDTFWNTTGPEIPDNIYQGASKTVNFSKID